MSLHYAKRLTCLFLPIKISHPQHSKYVYNHKVKEQLSWQNHDKAFHSITQAESCVSFNEMLASLLTVNTKCMAFL